jgi:hypothetical protein
MRSPALLASMTICALPGCEDPSSDPGEETEAVCYDTLDNDDDGDLDCADAGCADLPTCCVGVATPECCSGASEIFAASLRDCTTGIADCVPELAPFGGRLPVVVDGAIAADPGPGDNGVYLPDPLDVAGSAYRITIEAATATDCPGSCLNYVAAGVISSLADVPWIDSYPLAVVLRPNRGDGALFAYGEVLGSWTVEPGFRRYTLDLRPDGTASLDEVDASGATLRELVPEFAWGASHQEPAWLAVTGRSEGMPAGELPARVRAVDVSRSVCDMPQRVGAEDAPVFPRAGSPEAAALPRIDGVGRAANAAGAEAVVIDAGDALHLLRADPATGEYALVHALDAPLLTAADLPGLAAGATLDDPWLTADDAAGRWQLYLTVRTSAAASAIGRISSGPGFADTLDPATFTVVAEGDGTYPHLEAPTVAGDVLIARARGADPAVLVRLERDGPDRWLPAGGTLADARVHGPHPDDLFAMDRDEVSDPALVEVDGMYRLLFAGRNGTRWRIGALVSLGGEHWLQPLGAEPLWDDTGFGALSVRDPAPWPVDGMLRLLYVGDDGTGTTAVGRATSGTTATWP